MAKKKSASNEGFGLGLEHFIVDRKTLAPLPTALLESAGTREHWPWNEARTGTRVNASAPDKTFVGISDRLASDLVNLNAQVTSLTGGMLLPTGAHPFAALADTMSSDTASTSVPWADPDLVWTSCARIELPFSDEQAFGRLHTAIRMVLPIVPAISASAPFIHGKRASSLSARLTTLLSGTRAMTELTGSYIPEVALDQADYYRIVLQPIARALAAKGLADTVDYQLANRRAAIPSFERGTITITVADTQECAGSDAAIAAMTVAVVSAMTDGRWVSNYLQRAWHEADLKVILSDVVRSGGDAVIANRDYLLMFGMMRESATAAELWRHLYQQLRGELGEAARLRMAHVLDHGCLARRILHHTGERPSRERLVEVYQELAACLRENRAFI